jgi:filamentous hemagglutinin
MHPAWAGADGNWPAVDEVFDPSIVQQQDKLACGAACGEMLLRNYGLIVSQELIIDQTEVPITAALLAEVMNSFEPSNKLSWVGGPLGIPGVTRADVFEVLNTTGSWIAILWETGAKIGHMVIVDGVDLLEYVLIRDPWQGTRYKLRKEDFLHYWSDYGVYRRK